MLTEEAVINAISKMLGTNIICSNFKSEQLQGGTVGDVRLITGNAETTCGAILPYKIILKVQKKWERGNDPDSWRREYDLYKSDLGSLFNDSFRWPVCYHAEMNDEETETQLWLEYIDGVSGDDLTVCMFEYAALEIGRFQGKQYAKKPDFSNEITIFYNDGKIRLIDWDTAGWGYIGEDIKQLISDETDPCYMVEYYRKCVPAYYKGFSEYADISHITDNCIREMILVSVGYRLVEWYKSAKTPDEKTLHLDTLQKIYEIGDCI